MVAWVCADQPDFSDPTIAIISTQIEVHHFVTFPLPRCSPEKIADFAQKTLEFTFYSLYDICMSSIRDILREEMEECTQIRANEVAILKFFQKSAGNKRPGSVELERHKLLMRRSLSSHESTSNTD
jgi:hypothetical protein